MAIGRKGVVFTLMAVVISLLILSIERAQDTPLSPLQAETLAADTRISVVNAYTSTFEEYAAQSLATAGYVTLVNMSHRVRADAKFFASPSPSVNATVRGCILNGTINVSNQFVTCLPDGYGVDDALLQLTDLASSELGITTSYFIDDAWVSEENPLEVVFWMRIDYNVSDAFASWEYHDVLVRAPVSAKGIPDPVYEYLVATGVTGETRNFSLTPIRRSQFNTTMFDAFYGNRSYVFLDNRSPSVLQRYAGDLTAKSGCCGVESIPDRARFPLPSPNAYTNYSMTDHQLLAHLMGTLPRFNCTILEVKSKQQAGHTLVLDTWRFDTLYNLTGTQQQACALPVG